MAVSFASPYKGPGRGFIYTTSSSHSTASSAGLAQAPAVSMGSVSRGAGSSRSRGVSSTMGSVSVAMPEVAPSKGIYTAATAVSGGVTTYDKAPKKPRGGVRRSQAYPGGVVSDCECPWDFDKENDKYVCPVCGCEIEMDVIQDGDGHIHCDCDPCRCPIEWDWSVWAFLALLAGGYAIWKKNRHAMPDNGRC